LDEKDNHPIKRLFQQLNSRTTSLPGNSSDEKTNRPMMHIKKPCPGTESEQGFEFLFSSGLNGSHG
jgi:hypothetical protein